MRFDCINQGLNAAYCLQAPPDELAVRRRGDVGLQRVVETSQSCRLRSPTTWAAMSQRCAWLPDYDPHLLYPYVDLNPNIDPNPNPNRNTNLIHSTCPGCESAIVSPNLTLCESKKRLS